MVIRQQALFFMKNTAALLALVLAAHSPLFGATRADAYLL